MSLFQRVGRIAPGSLSLIAPQSTGGGSLGSTLFITPRTFTYNTYAGPGIFNLADEGLYGVLAYDPAYGTPPGVYADGGYRIVTKSDGTMPLLPFMEAMAAICIYGNTDNGLSVSSMQGIAKSRKLEMQCGDTINFVLGCAAQVGITARMVRLLTADTPNNADDGHVLCEAQDVNGYWVLFDVAGDCCFQDGSGNFLSLAEVIDAGVANCTLVPLAESSAGNAPYSSSRMAARVYYEIALATPEKRAAWRDRIYQIPAIDNASGVPVAFMPPGTESRQSWVQSLGYSVVTRSAFDAAFYP